jgi:hypothetical protein
MELSTLSDAEVAVTARALSIHRVSVRRKLDRLRPGTPEHRQALTEMTETTQAIAKLNAADLKRVSAA